MTDAAAHDAPGGKESASDRVARLVAEIKADLTDQRETVSTLIAECRQTAAERDRLRQEHDVALSEIAVLRRSLLQAFTVVEWVAGEGYMLNPPHYDADDLLLDLVEILGVEDSNEARAALAQAEDTGT